MNVLDMFMWLVNFFVVYGYVMVFIVGFFIFGLFVVLVKIVVFVGVLCSICECEGFFFGEG